MGGIAAERHEVKVKVDGSHVIRNVLAGCEQRKLGCNLHEAPCNSVAIVLSAGLAVQMRREGRARGWPVYVEQPLHMS